ncbi:hypothetical protein BJ085DRAFT_20864 [Dimargaris cristalligena]|uniref:Uncharacterized protein n=1 Tax=Dimargaris cristalligena TaxID=215637 RepID=A0A4P9ZP93_9FUNG|nr:hypothetical protein BJ085DRAFT_20864 [Dimargaris cristalligena]|eukprot:RKP34461.1 hypothetical protein BJ085DRAFT_20864 [Dimargaris cristalligena]
MYLAKKYLGYWSQDKAKHIITSIWEVIDTTYLAPYFESMPSRIQAVIDAKGGLT